MAEELGRFLASWKLLSGSDKENGIAAFAKNFGHQAPDKKSTTTSKEQSASCPSKIYNDIFLSVNTTYFYYCPTMHWSLNKPPEDDTYWVGIFPSNGSDDDYLTYKYIDDGVSETKGSYYCGKLKATHEFVSSKRYDKFELRIFHGNKRLKAETNELRGVMNIYANDPSSPFTPTSLADIASSRPDTETQAIETAAANVIPVSSSLAVLSKQWDTFTPDQQQLLFPLLDQASLPDVNTNAAPNRSGGQEPKSRFSDLKNRKLGPAKGTGSEPDQIVLSITLNHAYIYIDPVLRLDEKKPSEKTWIGVYRLEKYVLFEILCVFLSSTLFSLIVFIQGFVL